MYSIFYDLETTDQNCVGQILNYAFVALDSNWQEVDRLTGNIRISRLQLPRVGAILANRTNVLEHQKKHELTEPQAMQAIHAFFHRVCKLAGHDPILIGYNSSGFDLKFLRTSLIRNGVAAYKPKLIQGDLLLLSRYLAISNQDFLNQIEPEGDEKFSLSLQNLCQHFDLLQGEQQHESLADVLLTVELAKIYKERFQMDVRKFEGYRADTGLERGQVAIRQELDYKGSKGDRVKESSVMFLDEDHRSALWLDLDRYAKGMGRASIIYRRKQCGEFSIRYGKVSRECDRLANQALDEFKGVRCSNYFKPTSCDIEQNIYRLDFDGADALAAAIWQGNLDPLSRVTKKSRDARILYLRYQLNNYRWGGGSDDKMKKALKQYAEYRYGGSMQLAYYLDEEASQDSDEGWNDQKFHPTFQQLQKELADWQVIARPEDRELLEALSKFYKSAELVQIAGLS